LFQSVPVLDIIRLVVKREGKKKIGKSIYHWERLRQRVRERGRERDGKIAINALQLRSVLFWRLRCCSRERKRKRILWERERDGERAREREREMKSIRGRSQPEACYQKVPAHPKPVRTAAMLLLMIVSPMFIVFMYVFRPLSSSTSSSSSSSWLQSLP
jgi:hypothetical protein